MKMTPAFLLPAAIGLSFFAGCGNGNREQSGNTSDSLYSGARFNEHIRTTEARTPEEERRGFRLPDGFEINLFASEPDIGKPINLAFDARGRMWVTQSFEYPFAAKPGTGKDRVTILEDTDGDGKADKFVQFTDTLNIPIGVLPTNDGAVVYSIPNVYKLIDNNGDGRPDSSKKMMGPFDVRDTHGMVNNFQWGFDGWIHGCHGYANRSAVAGADGDSVHLVSGNTIRFRPDGSRVEVETFGRINPFGLTYDELGYLYSTDCHTSPLYQLIRGGDYMQWGKEEGMGFAPDMKPLENEATALAGISYYADMLYPEKYRSNFYIGDAVSSRVYRNSFSWKGSSPVGKREDDFVLSADPWFRPVDVKMGPDGAVYIADFYNSIIGHYEVPLEHPKRDRIRGRIWRITYKGKVNKNTDLLNASPEALFKALKSSNLSVRLMALYQLADRIGTASIEPAMAILSKKDAATTEYVHSLWVLQRLRALSEDVIRAAATHPDPVIRVHAMRVIAEQKDTSAALYPLIVKSMEEDRSPHVKRAALELMGRYVNMETVEKLVAFRKKIPEDDSHMIYTARLKLRNLLRHEPLMAQTAAAQWSNEDANVLSTVMVGVETPASGIFMYNYVKNYDLPKVDLPKAFTHIVRFVPQQQVDQVISAAMERSTRDSELEFRLFKSLREGIAKRAGNEPASFKSWGIQIVNNLLGHAKKHNGSQRSPEILEQQLFAADLAGDYQIKGAMPEVTAIFRDTASPNHLRSAALRALLKTDALKYSPLAGSALQDDAAMPELKRSIVAVMSEFPSNAVNHVLTQVKNPSPDLQQGIVLALAGSANGKNLIFKKVSKGEIFPRTLVEPKVEERLMLNITPDQKKMYRELTAGLEGIDSEKQALIKGRVADYNNLHDRPPPETGHTVYVKNCSPCHSVKGEGGAIGPQLDGVGKWGVEPLSEKILDPNRNVSENFRNYTLKLRDGKVLSGLYRRDEGQVIIFADATGQEFAVSKQDIVDRKASKYTLMPDQFRNTISINDFNALLSYLLIQKN